MNLKLLRTSVGRFWIAVNLQFEPSDIWVGLFVRGRTIEGGHRLTHLYICVLPMLPLHITIARSK